ncbi:MAG: hypothetical protein JW818_19600, partial [Pirellulales bacterium]|nr:hypothetical protein [Pirellulales bacterium]
LIETIGAGTPGRTDGDFRTAQFDDPQGMALVGNTLFVADTENHLIRRVDLNAKRVTTVAGTGQQLRRMTSTAMRGSPLRTELASPWALWADEKGGWLYIAMAGTHQIWRMRLDGSQIGPYAGSGLEDIVDGQRLASRPFQRGYAAFAQPSGLASDGRWLYVADSEGSSIRAVPLDPKEPVRTVVGTSRFPDGTRLFTFGDVDGSGPQVRLQHALGVAWHDGRIYVADTYNNKIKVVDPVSGAVHTLAGTGQRGHTAQPATFDEPGGLSVAGDKLYVADTNNHLIRVIDLKQGDKVSTLVIPRLRGRE